MGGGGARAGIAAVGRRPPLLAVGVRADGAAVPRRDAVPRRPAGELELQPGVSVAQENRQSLSGPRSNSLTSTTAACSIGPYTCGNRSPVPTASSRTGL